MNIKSLVLLGSIFAAYTGIVFGVGWAYQANTTAISLSRPFGMKLEVDLKEFPFPKLVLTKHYTVEGSDGEKIVLLLRMYDESVGLYNQIGEVIAQKAKAKEVTQLHLDITKNLYAQDQFDWNDHKSNFKFYERFVAPGTIRRYYNDGWILEYKVDKDGRAIESSRKWIKRN
jgi:hypothetical protein